MTAVREARPSERRGLEIWLERRGVAGWPPGRTYAAAVGEDVVGVARVGEPSPGDGYHREHVRTLHVAGEASAARPLLVRAAADAPASLRLAAETRAGEDPHEAALRAAGLAPEVTLARHPPARAIRLWGRCASPRPSMPDALRPAPSAARGDGAAVRVVVHGAATRAVLARFLATLVPGRSLPPGTLLSEAERLETSRRGELDLPWLLALDGPGEVAGGLVLEPDPRGPLERAARVHLDVRPELRGRGVGEALAREAAAWARGLGLAVLEADPRAGNVGACRALERGGFELAGVEAGAWRMRRGGEVWDEDVRWYQAVL